MKNLSYILLLALLIGSCTTARYVPVETVRVDSLFVAKAQRDSIFERDSVFVAVKADTVFHTRTLYRYRDRVVRDTVFRLKCDTVTKVVEVQKKLSFWQQRKLELGGVAMFLALLLFGIIIIKSRMQK